MDKNASVPGSRQLNLKKSFKRALRSLLSSCSDEEFRKAFPKFTDSEKNRLRQLFIQIITSAHQGLEEEFESIMLQTQAGTALDAAEDLIEAYNLDPLFAEETTIGEVVDNLAEEKKNEVNRLRRRLEEAEEQNQKIKAELEALHKEKQDMAAAELLLQTLRTTNSCYSSQP